MLFNNRRESISSQLVITALIRAGFNVQGLSKQTGLSSTRIIAKLDYSLKEMMRSMVQVEIGTRFNRFRELSSTREYSHKTRIT